MSSTLQPEDLVVDNEAQGPNSETGSLNIDEEFLKAEKRMDKLAIDQDELDEDDIDVPLSETASISSSLYDHVEENGRTYHKYKEGKYMLPNDELEQNRLDFQHYLCKLTLHGRLHLAPLKKSRLEYVLDFGTGTGIWAIEFAQEYPDAEIIGSDLSPIQPEFVPPNLSFEVDDMDDEWIYPHKFSYIHSRLMVFCFLDPVGIFKKAFDSLEPGGFLEMQDTCGPLLSIDNTIEGTTLNKCWKLMTEVAGKMGVDLAGARKYKAIMESIGFVDVKEVVLEWPFGTWAKSAHHKRIGTWLVKDMSLGLKGMFMRMFTTGLGMTKEEVEKMADDAIADMTNKNIHAYQQFYVVYGRKPRVGEKTTAKEEAVTPVSTGGLAKAEK